MTFSFHALVSSVMLRELRSLGRSRLAYAMRAIVALGTAAALVAAVLPYVNEQQRASAYIGPAYNVANPVNALPLLGQDFFALLTVGCWFALLVVVPALTAGIIAGEVERKTLGLLVISRLRYHQIIGAKLTARLLYLVMLLASMAPLCGVFLYLGGVDQTDLLLAAYALAVELVFLVAAGLLCTCLMGSTSSAMVATYLVYALVRLPTMLVEISLGDSVLWRKLLMLLLVFGKPSRGISYTILNSKAARFSFDGSPPLDNLHLTFALAVSFLLVVLALAPWLLRRALRDNRTDPVKRLVGWFQRRFRGRGFLGRTVIHDNTPIGNAPLRWRELHKRFYTSNGFCVRLFFLSIILAMVACLLMSFMDARNWVADWLWRLTACAIPLVVLIGAAGSFTVDRQQGTWEVLMTTPVRGGAIYLAKLAGQVKLAIVATIALTAMTLAMAVWGIDVHYLLPIAALFTLVMSLLQLPLVMALGIGRSLRCRNLALAALAALAIWFLLNYLLLAAACLPDTVSRYIHQPNAYKSGSSPQTLVDVVYWAATFKRLDLDSFLYAQVAACLLGLALLLFQGTRFDRLVRRP